MYRFRDFTSIPRSACLISKPHDIGYSTLVTQWGIGQDPPVQEQLHVFSIHTSTVVTPPSVLKNLGHQNKRRKEKDASSMSNEYIV